MSTGRVCTQFSFFLGLFAGLEGAQLDKNDEFQVIEGIYQEKTIESFESRENVEITMRTAGVSFYYITSAFPAPVVNSKKYAGWYISENASETISLTFSQPKQVEGYCSRLNIWVYGTYLAGEISIMLKDSHENVHTLSFGNLRFRGWKKLSVAVPDEVIQKDLNLGINNPVSIIRISYNPGHEDREKKWNLFFIDELTAHTRSRYMLPGQAKESKP